MIPITAILVSVVVIPESLSSSSSLVAVFGKSKELSIHTLIATANGVSSDNAALHIPLLNFFLLMRVLQWWWKKEGSSLMGGEVKLGGFREGEIEAVVASVIIEGRRWRLGFKERV